MTTPPRRAAHDPARLTTLAAVLREAAEDLQSVQPPRLPAHRVAEALARPALPALVATAVGPGVPGWPPSGPAARRRGPGAGRWLLPAGLVVTAVVLWGLTLRPAAVPHVAPSHSGETGTAFLPIRGAEHWPRPAAGDPGLAWLVRAELPRERLALLGLPFDPARAGDRVPAELLLNPEGDVIAVRLVR